jgi:hypothetical protein
MDIMPVSYNDGKGFFGTIVTVVLSVFTWGAISFAVVAGALFAYKYVMLGHF